MRHIFKMMTFAALFAAIFSSCSSDSLLQDQPKRHTTLHLNMDYPNSSNDTKATKKGWANNDLVFLFFGTQMYSGYNTNEYVKLRRSGPRWIIEKGQELLDALNDGEGYIQAVHYTGTEDPIPYDYTSDYKGDGKNDLKDGYSDDKGGKDDMDFMKGINIFAHGGFALYTPTPAQYTKSTDDLTANLTFVTYDEIQLNLKFIESLNIVEFFMYDGDRGVSVTTFGGGKLLSSGLQLNPSYTFTASPGVDSQVKESSIFLNFRNDRELVSTATVSGSRTTYHFTNSIGFEIWFKSGNSNYYKLTRTISTKDLTSGNVYTINGPTVSLSDLQETPLNGDVGNKWILSGGGGVEVPNSAIGTSIFIPDFYNAGADDNGIELF